jgi:hypothetical protein
MKRPARNQVNRLLLAALAATPLLAGAASGEFTFVVGDVSLAKANGQRSTPVKGTPVDPGDRITTGGNGMAQLSMVDQARLSLRPNTQFQIEAYPDRRDSDQGAVLNLVKGTLRTFTGLIASTNRDKFVMKTRVATVGIRGSGNILHACEGNECDESIPGASKVEGGVAVNHTIEGSHAVTNILAEARPGVPAQQGGASTLITGPGQTVMVAGREPPRYIPMPRFIADAATNMTAAKPAETVAAASTGDTRNFSPSDTPTLPASQQQTTTVIGNNGLGFVSDIDATANLSGDPIGLHDIIIAAGSPFPGQAITSQMQLNGNEFRGYTAYAGSQSGIAPAITGGTLRDSQLIVVDGQAITLGRYENAGLGIFGPGSSTPLPGSIHWIVGASGYPLYLADVLTGTATYTLAAATSPTNQLNTAGTLGSAQINANFTARTLGLQAALALPAAGSNPGGSWQLVATGVPFSLNAFFGSTADRLVITNGTGQSSTGNNPNLTGSFEGSFVGTGIAGVILGYGISDRTATSSSAWNFITGVAAFTGPHQDGAASFREGRISDPAGLLPDFIRSYATTDRPDEVTFDAQNRVTAFSAPYGRFGSHSSYTIGTAQVVESGFDAETGLVWGRWSGGVANVARAGQTDQLFLGNASLHYIFAGQQAGPVALPLTGTGIYDVMGSTSPTNGAGQVGTLSSATLNANFTNRTVDTAVVIAIANQTWNGSASNVPIYRDAYFSAYSGTPIPGVPNPSPLQITCSPNCGTGATGSIDGFFAGPSGNRAGMMYNLGGNQGAVAFRRRGG